MDAIGEIPPERWNADQYFDSNPDAPGKMCTRWGGFLKDVDRFDAEFFGVAPREVLSDATLGLVTQAEYSLSLTPYQYLWIDLSLS